MQFPTLISGNTKFVVVDNLPPEVLAMLQAFYSRSHKSIIDRLDSLMSSTEGESEKIKESMKRFYIGYGHKSIADCGFTTIFIENISMLAAKAIQDNALYNGQEASTRYIDFSNQPLVGCIIEADLTSNKTGQDFQKQLIDIAMKEFHPALVSRFKSERPINEGESPQVYENAMNAKAFDVVRGLLPAGCTTQVAWTTSLRSARDNIIRLYLNPLWEVKQIAKNLWSLLSEAYPSSFEKYLTDAPELSKDDTWLQKTYRKFSYMNLNGIDTSDFWSAGEGTAKVLFDTQRLHSPLATEMLEVLKSRPKGAQVPNSFSLVGRLRLSFNLDFGGFRDLQRHRNGIIPMPEIFNLNQKSISLHPFYKSYLQCYPEINTKVENLLCNIAGWLNSIDFVIGAYGDHLGAQYYVPMGINIPVYVDFSLPQAIYVAELRSQSTVHPIVREVAQTIGEIVSEEFNIPVYLGKDYSGSIHRGSQTIVEK